MARAFSKVKGYVTDSLDKIQSQSWAEPAGQILGVTATVVKGLKDFVPGAGILGGALSFGASMLNPQPSMKELQKEMVEIKHALGNSSLLKNTLIEREEKIKELMENPISEIKQNMREVTDDVKRLLPAIQDFSKNITDEMDEIKDKIEETFRIVTDLRYKGGIETIDAAYETFLEEDLEDFKEYAYELKTTAKKNLSPQRIQDYLKLIYKHHDVAMTQHVLEYIVVVYAKFLQMSVAYNIHRNKPDKVTAEFERFNSDYARMVDIFKQITGEEFKPGQKIKAIPKAEVKPMKRVDTADPDISDRERKELQEFLASNNLEELGEKLFRDGVTLEDIYDMDDEDMKKVGVKTFKLRKQLARAAEDHRNLLDRPLGARVAAASSFVTAPRAKVREASPDGAKTIEPKGGELSRLKEQKTTAPSSGQLVVSSTGPATEYQGAGLGLYEQQDGEHEGAPYYKQTHDTAVPWTIFLYRTGDTWVIGDTIGGGGAMKCPAKGSKTPPQHGWTLWTGEEDMPDATLKFSTSPFTWCPHLTVSATGAAARKHPKCLGRYQATSFTSCGRKVYRSEGGMFLLVRPRTSTWSIQPSVEGEGGAMQSGSAPLCPGSRRAATSDRCKQNNWEYNDSGEAKEGDITVSCPVHS